MSGQEDSMLHLDVLIAVSPIAVNDSINSGFVF